MSHDRTLSCMLKADTCFLCSSRRLLSRCSTAGHGQAQLLTKLLSNHVEPNQTVAYEG